MKEVLKYVRRQKNQKDEKVLEANAYGSTYAEDF